LLLEKERMQNNFNIIGNLDADSESINNSFKNAERRKPSKNTSDDEIIYDKKNKTTWKMADIDVIYFSF